MSYLVDGEDREYTRARARLRDLIGEGSEIQQRLDAKGDGLVLCQWLDPADNEEKVYVTANPELIHEYCDRLEAQRASN